MEIVLFLFFVLSASADIPPMVVGTETKAQCEFYREAELTLARDHPELAIIQISPCFPATVTRQPDA